MKKKIGGLGGWGDISRGPRQTQQSRWGGKRKKKEKTCQEDCSLLTNDLRK